jgi:hypothetical protein
VLDQIPAPPRVPGQNRKKAVQRWRFDRQGLGRWNSLSHQDGSALTERARIVIDANGRRAVASVVRAIESNARFALRCWYVRHARVLVEV